MTTQRIALRRADQLRQLRRTLLAIQICGNYAKHAADPHVRRMHEAQRVHMVKRAFRLGEEIYNEPFHSLVDLQNVVAADLRVEGARHVRG